jgi:predicted nucleotidyltransferase
MIILNVKSKTMKRDQIIRTIKEVLSERGIKKAYLFGSFARREQYHDIDIAIEPPKGKFSLLDIVSVEQELEDETGKNVDVVILRSIKPRLKPYIEKDLTSIL